MKLTTVLCNYNTRDVLACALESLLATQGDLARLSGMSVNLVCQIENGKATVQTCKLLDLLSALGLHFVLADGQNRILLNDEFLKK